MSLLSLVIPTYNEAKNIEGLCRRILGLFPVAGCDLEIIVVDDHSPDGTAGIVERLSRAYACIRLIQRKKERGLATAVLCGWQQAQGDILGVIDADLQHPPELLGPMLSLLEKQPDTDIVIASRNVPGGGVSQWSCWRRFISSSATCVSRLLLRQVLKGVRDPMSGYFLLRRPVIEGKVLSPLGYKILLEVLVKGNYRRAAELPYIFEERKKGGSKAGLRQYWMGFRHMLKLKKELRGY